MSFKPQEIKVKEEDITSYYQENLDQYKKKSSPPKESFPIPLEEVRADIRDTLANQKAKENAREEAEDLACNLFDRTDWETIVKERKLKVKETGFFARGESIKDLGWAPDFVKEAFALEEDEVSGAIETPKGYAILTIKERSKSHLPQLEEVRDKVEERIREQKARILARTKAQECRRGLRGGNDFESMAKEFSLEVKDSEFFSREGYIKGIGFSSPFARIAFSLPEGEISSVVEVSQGFAILKIEAKEGIDEKKYASEAEEFRKKLLPWKQMGVYNQWYQTLREEARIWIDPDFKEKSGKTMGG